MNNEMGIGGISFGLATHVGKERLVNQDGAGAWVSTAGGPILGVFILADGMGGGHAGEDASKLAIELFLEEFSTYSGSCDKDVLLCAMKDSLSNINRQIYDLSRQRHADQMGTTVDAIVVTTSGVFMVHVGDARIYSIGDAGTNQITDDHSVVNDLVSRGVSLEAALASIGTNQVVHMVGTGGATDPRIDPHACELIPGTAFLICSDGVHGSLEKNPPFCVGPVDMKNAVDGTRSLQAAAEYVVKMAVQRDGADNATCLILRVEPEGQKPVYPAKYKPGESLIIQEPGPAAWIKVSTPSNVVPGDESPAMGPASLEVDDDNTRNTLSTSTIIMIFAAVFSFVALIVLTLVVIDKHNKSIEDNIAPTSSGGAPETGVESLNDNGKEEETKVNSKFKQAAETFVKFKEISPLTEAGAMNFIEGKVGEWKALKALVGDTNKVVDLFCEKLQKGNLGPLDEKIGGLIQESFYCYGNVRLSETIFNKKPEKLSINNPLVKGLIEYVGALENVIGYETVDKKSGWLKEISQPRKGWKKGELGRIYKGEPAQWMTALVSFKDYHGKFREFNGAKKYADATKIHKELLRIERELGELKLNKKFVWVIYTDNEKGVYHSLEAIDTLEKCNQAKEDIDALIKDWPSFSNNLSLDDTKNHLVKILKKIEKIDKTITEKGESLAYIDVKEKLNRDFRKKRNGLCESVKEQVKRFCEEEINEAMKVGVHREAELSNRIKKFNGTINRVLKKVCAPEQVKASRVAFLQAIGERAGKSAMKAKSPDLGIEVEKLFEIAKKFLSINQSDKTLGAYNKKINALNGLVNNCETLEEEKNKCIERGDIEGYKGFYDKVLKIKNDYKNSFSNKLHVSYGEFLIEVEPGKVKEEIRTIRQEYEKKGMRYAQYLSLLTAISWEDKRIQGKLLTEHFEKGLPEDEKVRHNLDELIGEDNNLSGQNNNEKPPVPISKKLCQLFCNHINAIANDSAREKYYKAFRKQFKDELKSILDSRPPLAVKPLFNKAIKNEEVLAIVVKVLDCLNIVVDLRKKVPHKSPEKKGSLQPEEGIISDES